MCREVVHRSHMSPLFVMLLLRLLLLMLPLCRYKESKAYPREPRGYLELKGCFLVKGEYLRCVRVCHYVSVHMWHFVCICDTVYVSACLPGLSYVVQSAFVVNLLNPTSTVESTVQLDCYELDIGSAATVHKPRAAQSVAFRGEILVPEEQE